MKRDLLLRTNNLLNILLLFLPLSVFIDNVCLILIFLIAVFGILKGNKIKYTPLLYILPFIIYILFRSFSVGYFIEDLKFFKLILPLVLIPFSFQIFSKKDYQDSYKFLFFGIVIMQLISVYGILDYYLFTEEKKIALRNYGRINEILRFERPYLGFLSAVNVILGYYFFRLYKQWYYIISIFFSLVIIFLISARLAYLIVVVSAGIIFFKELKENKTRIIIFASFFLTIGLFLYFANIPLKHRFQMIKYDARITIWSGGIEQIKTKKDYLFGIGSQKLLKDNMLNFYKNEAEFEYLPDKNRFVNKNYNLHNQYLNELVRGGGIGVVLFVFPFIYFLYRSAIKNNFLHVLLLISILLFLVVENLLERQVGVYCLALFLTFAMYDNEEH